MGEIILWRGSEKRWSGPLDNRSTPRVVSRRRRGREPISRFEGRGRVARLDSGRLVGRVDWNISGDVLLLSVASACLRAR